MHQTMTLQLKTKAGLLDLHGSVGLLDWDMDKELKLATTTDQLYHDLQGPQEEMMTSMIKHQTENPSGRPVRNRRKGRVAKATDTKTLEPGCWPRPPVNYFILIALALKSSQTGSLKVQQIYNFTREHFPFFQTAPDGWKNTIRHNLCFNSSFRKTCNQQWRDGKRKSCFWHLTLDGHRRLQDELRMLTGETLKLLERSMSNRDLLEL
ncbi:forkhead box protein R1 isoform X3 [Kryptolebias marmoratus]|uniref:forkhead box protein R1 isoform X3 n=1 Tax=Kryptolebias marmoratus TaxID=37003 RepID=UPI000D530E38|nr:forkhead box protein R1 isoform X3 [Kryptolebias marmoratus]